MPIGRKKATKKSKMKKTVEIEKDDLLEDEDEDSIFDDEDDDDEIEEDEEEEIEDDEDEIEEDDDEEEEEIEEIKPKKKKATKPKKEKTAKKVLAAPKGVSPKLLKQAEKIVLKGFKDHKKENEIKTELAHSGLDFSKTIQLYKYITIEHNLIKSPAEIKNEVTEIINESNILSTVSEKIEEDKEDELDYFFFEPIIATIKESIPSVTERKIVSIFNELLDDVNFKIPSKPKGKRISKIDKAVVNYFYNNDEYDIDSFKEALEKATTERGAKRWLKMFKLLTTIANGQTAEQGLR